MKTIISRLKNNNKTISTMESCTGGALASAITDIPGASDVFKFGAVTYSNEFKIKMGVDSEVINNYTVYSTETAQEMSYKICKFTGSDYGIGITGRLNRADKNNPGGKENKVYISIYSLGKNKFYDYLTEAQSINRKTNKKMILNYIKDKLIGVLDEEN